VTIGDLIVPTGLIVIGTIIVIAFTISVPTINVGTLMFGTLHIVSKYRAKRPHTILPLLSSLGLMSFFSLQLGRPRSYAGLMFLWGARPAGPLQLRTPHTMDPLPSGH